MEMNEKQLELLQRVKDTYKEVGLAEVGYGEMLSSDDIQDIIDNGYDNIWESLDTWEQEMYSIDYLIREIYTSDEIDYMKNTDSGKLMDDVIDYLRSIDTSNYLQGLINNTRGVIFTYCTGIYCDEYNYGKGKDFRKEVRLMGLKLKDNEVPLNEIDVWNFYGGEIQLIFRMDMSDLDKILKEYNDKKKLIINNPCIALTNTGNGSGGYAYFNGTVKIDFNKNNLSVYDKAHGYTIHEVYGDNTIGEASDDVRVINGRKKVSQEENYERKREKELDNDLKKGICHIDDTRFSSHDFDYRIEYPAGWTCKKCNRFVID